MRLIDGIWYRCLDVGCDDFNHAARNRRMMSRKWHIKGYVEIENALAGLGLNQKLPPGIPIGNLPTINTRNIAKSMHIMSKEDDN